MRMLTAVVQAGLIGAVAYVAIRIWQDELADRRFWRAVRDWMDDQAPVRRR